MDKQFLDNYFATAFEQAKKDCCIQLNFGVYYTPRF